MAGRYSRAQGPCPPLGEKGTETGEGAESRTEGQDRHLGRRQCETWNSIVRERDTERWRELKAGGHVLTSDNEKLLKTVGCGSNGVCFACVSFDQSADLLSAS